MKNKLTCGLIGKLVTGLLVMMIVAGAIYILTGNINSVYAAESTVEDVDDYKVKTYTEITDYRQQGALTAPELSAEEVTNPDKWLFAGWYTDDTCKTALSSSTVCTDDSKMTGEYYAKFVSTDVLGVKCQITSNTTSESESTVLRTISTVDSLKYKRIGFDLVTSDGKTYTMNNNKVNTRIQAKTDKIEAFSYSPKVVDAESEYFFSATYEVDLTEENALTKGYLIKPYWMTKDGTTVYGISRYITMDEAINKSVIHIPVKAESDPTEAGNEITYTVDGTNANCVAYDKDGGYAHLALAEVPTDSATQYTITGSDGTNATYIYRNLNTTYTETTDADNNTTDTADDSWYKVYLDASGNPTKDEFVIATSADLYGFADLVNAKNVFENCTVYLVSDINANNGTEYYWNDVGNEVATTRFNGVFDGQMHSISGIKYNQSKSVYNGKNFRGFFGGIGPKAEIKNFKLLNSTFDFGSTNNCGSIVGRAYGGTIENVYSEANVSSSNQHLGGMVGATNTSSVTMKNCWFSGTVTATYGGTDKACIGGLIGNAGAGATITNCKNTGAIVLSRTTTGAGCIGGLVARMNATTTINNCLSAGTITLGASSDATSIVTTACGTVVGGKDNGTLTCENVYATKDSFSQEVDDATTIFASAAVNGGDGTDYGTITMISKNALNGVAAYANTTGLSYYTDNSEGAWVIGEDLSPVPKVFADKWIDIKWFWDGVKAKTSANSDGEYTSSEIVANNGYAFTILDADDFYGLPVIAATYNFATDTISLANDIELNSGKATDWAAGYTAGARKWTAIGSDSTPFAGTFDGDGHEISGIYLSETVLRKGLFGTVSGAIIQNFKIVNSYFYSTNQYLGSVAGRVAADSTFMKIYSEANVLANDQGVGGLIGHATTGYKITIKDCWFNGKVECSSTSVKSLGGLVGQGKVNMTNCLNTGKVTSNYSGDEAPNVGGLLGMVVTDAVITNCLNTGKISYSTTGTTGFGSIVGGLNKTTDSLTIENSYALKGTCDVTDSEGNTTTVLGNGETTDLTIEKSTEVNALTNMPDLFKYQEDGKYTGYWAMTSDGAPVLETFAEYAGKTYMGVDLSWYDETGNYSLSDAADFYGLALLSQTHKFEDEKITLSDDITINEGDSDDWYKKAPDFGWLRIGTNLNERFFLGEFDGNGKSISGVYLNAATTNMNGLFGATGAGAKIHDFSLVNSYFTSTQAILGSVVGRVTGGEFYNIYSNAIVETSSESHIGGILGQIYTDSANVSVRDCWFDGSIKGMTHVGGIVGRINGPAAITNCLNGGKITSTSQASTLYVGGLAGSVGDKCSSASIQYCLNVGNLICNKDGITGYGSILGSADDYAITIENTYATKESCDVFATGTAVVIDGETSKWQVSQDDIKGDAVSDWALFKQDETHWVTVTDSYPVLKCFADLAGSGNDIWTSQLKIAIENCESGETIKADVSEPILESNAVAITEGYHQGGCTDGKYFYQAHITYKDSENEDNNKVIILKYDMKTGKLVKQSDEMSLNHANDVTYNSRMGYLVVCHSVGEPRQITLIDADTLVEIKKITLPMAIRGSDYNATRNCYAVAWEKTTDTDAVEHCISILDSNFEKIVDYVVSTNPTLVSSATVPQGMSSDDDYLYFLYYNQSTFQHVITVFDWEGNYKTEIEFTMSDMEPENISVVEGEIYCLAKRKVYRLIVN